MDQRDLGVAELISRLRENKDTIGISRFIETPTGEIDPENVPAILFEEGIDEIEQYSNRTKIGYPARRKLEVCFECIVDIRNTDLRTFCKDVRRVLFTNRSTGKIDPVLIEHVFIRESRMEGPVGYGLPNINGMKLFFNFVYTDEGI